MKLIRVLFLVFVLFSSFLIFSFFGKAKAATLSFNISQKPTSVAKYDKYEIVFSISGLSYTNLNPFNPNPVAATGSNPYQQAGIDVEGVFTKPDGVTTITQPAFYNGSQTWKLRFAAKETGNWKYHLSANTVGDSGASPDYNFTVTDSTNKGFLKVSPTDTRFLQFDNDQVFNPIGLDISGTGTTDIWNTALPAMKANGVNFSRVFMSSWFLETMNYNCNNINNYNLDDAITWDNLFNWGHDNDLYVEMLLDDWTKIKSRSDNGSNDYEACGIAAGVDGFYSNATLKEIYTRKLRYVLARWGYSPNLLAIELVNETANPSGTTTWHNDMAQYIHTQDAYFHHLVSSSNGSEELQADAGINWANMDIVNYHSYGKCTNPWTYGKFDVGIEKLGSINSLPWFDAAVWADRIARAYRGNGWSNKPIFFSEYGLGKPGGAGDWDTLWQSKDLNANPPRTVEGDVTGRHVEEAIWAAALQGYSISHWKLAYLDGSGIYSPAKYTVFKPLANYFNNVDLRGLNQQTTYPVTDSRNPSPTVTSNNNNVFAITMKGNDKAYLYVKNATKPWAQPFISTIDADCESWGKSVRPITMPAPSNQSANITVVGLSNIISGAYNLETWSTTQPTAPTTDNCITNGNLCAVNDNGSITIKISNMDVDVAYKILPNSFPPSQEPLQMTMSTDKQFVQKGDILKYTITVKNPNASAITNASVVAPKPDNCSLVDDCYIIDGSDTIEGVTGTPSYDAANTKWTFDVPANNQTVTMTYQVKMEPAPTSPPSPNIILTGATPVLWEAEDSSTTISSPMIIANDATASGGKYIYVPNGGGNNGSVTYPINAASSPGNYCLWGLSKWANTDDNSFNIQVDSGTTTTLTDYNYPPTTLWHWVKLPATFNLTGQHTLKVLQREDGSMLDKIVLTTNCSYNP